MGVRGAVVGLVALGVLGGGLAVADEFFRREVQADVERQLTTGLSASGPVDVQLDGWPFALAVWRDELPSGTIRAQDFVLNYNELAIPLRSAEVNLVDLVPMRNLNQAVAGSADGTVSMTWQQLNELTGAQLSSPAEGRVNLDLELSILDRALPVTITATPRLSGRQLLLEELSAEVAGQAIPEALLVDAVNLVADRLVLPELPGLTYDQLQVGPEALTVTVSGQDVPLDPLMP